MNRPPFFLHEVINKQNIIAMKKAFLESPKTTITGIIAGITMLAITFGFLSPDESSVVNKEIGVIISSVLTLLGIFSKDGDKD